MKKQYLAKNKALEKWMISARGSILANATPLQVRQAVAGSDQNRQASVVAVKVSRVVEVLLQLVAELEKFDMAEQVQKAIALTGFRRPDTKKQLHSEWNGVIFWSLSCRDLAVDALRRLEAQQLAGTPGSLRSFRKLITPVWRHKLAERILEGTIKTQKQLEGIITALRHDQWVQFHWREGNPNISNEKGVRCVRRSVARMCAQSRVISTRGNGVLHVMYSVQPRTRS